MILGILPNVSATESRRDAGSAISVLSCTSRTDGQTCDKPKQQSDEGAVAFLKDSRLLRCVFQDVEPPKFSSILQKSTAVSRPADTVQFSTNTLRHVKIRETKVHRLV